MSDYLVELVESARQVIAGVGTPAYEQETWPVIVELGWLLASVPESLDGLGLGVKGACMLHSELGRGLSQAPFLPAMMALDAICQSDLAEKPAWVERLTTGEFATASLVEPELGLAGTGALKNAFTGLVPAVQSADRASHVLVWSGEAGCVALVPLAQAGVEVIERPTWDITRRLFDLRFSQVVPEEQLVLASGSAAASLIARMQTLRDFALAADSVGAGKALLDMTVDHLLTRRQFGRPLALFQALKHRCADLKTGLAAAEALLNDSLAQLGDRIGDPESSLDGRKAKYLACSTFSRVAEEALQLHGGIGMAAEHPCHYFLKRAMLNEHLGACKGGYESGIADSFLGEQ